MKANSFSKNCVSAVAAGALLAVAMAGPARSDPGPFTGIQGSWHGHGRISLEGGKSEGVECNAYYTAKGGGSGIGIALSCASGDYKIRLRSSLTYSNGRISGDWEEREFNASGSASGKANDGHITLAFEGAVTGSMHVSTEGNQQTVSISTHGGVALRGVTITMHRTG